MTGWIVIWVLGVCAVAATAANHRYHWAHGWWYSWQRAAHMIEQTEREPVVAPEYGSMILDDERDWMAERWMAQDRGEISHDEPMDWRPPDWREQTAADLAPEALDILCAGCIGFEHCDGAEGACNCTCGFSADWAEPDDVDSGPSTPAPCPVCGGNRWRTVVKDQCWQCRDCGYERGHRDDSGPGDLSSLAPGPDRLGQGNAPPAVRSGAYEPQQEPLPGTRLADTGDIRDARLLADVTAFMRHHDAEKAEYLADLDVGWAQWWLNFTEALA